MKSIAMKPPALLDDFMTWPATGSMPFMIVGLPIGTYQFCNSLQIVQIPEPAATTLLVPAVLLLAHRRPREPRAAITQEPLTDQISDPGPGSARIFPNHPHQDHFAFSTFFTSFASLLPASAPDTYSLNVLHPKNNFLAL